jgi:methyl-galactoside transport system substrate-binding protein
MYFMRKRIIAGVLSLALLGMCSGCTNAEPSGVPGKIRIGVTLYDQYDTFISQLMECFNEKVGPEAEVIIYNASQSQQTQNQQVRKLVEDGCDVICVNLVDRTDPSTVIDLARKADIPLIFFNRELVEGDIGRWNKLFYVGADAVQSGVLQGELAAAACRKDPSIDRNGDGSIQYVVLEGEAGHQDSIVRTEYSVNTLTEKGVVVDRLGSAIANWNRAQAQTKTTQFIENYNSSIELLFANNDDMALGAIDAYEASGMDRDKWPVIFGIDGTDVGLDAVDQELLAGTVYNDKEGQAGAMYDLAITLAGGGSIYDLTDRYQVTEGKYIRLPYEKVTLSNIDEYLER